MNANELELEKKCEICKGTGMTSGHRCSDCKGKGYVLTQLGDALMALVRRHLALE